MLDVHVPQKSEHTWTDFLIHIATICVGLLIAIGLEQSVEAIHRAHERRDLRDALQAESAQILTDSRNSRQWADTERLLLNVRIAQLSAMRDKRPVPTLPGYALPGREIPSDPIWQAAKTSNSAALLSRDELTAYGELSQLCGDSRKVVVDQSFLALQSAIVYARKFGGDMMTANFSHASPAEVQEMIDRLLGVDEVLRHVAHSASETEGAAEAIHNDERDIVKIYAAEKTAYERADSAFAPRLAKAQTPPSSSSTQPKQ